MESYARRKALCGIHCGVRLLLLLCVESVFRPICSTPSPPSSSSVLLPLQVIVSELCKLGDKSISRHELRQTCRHSVGDTGLLDHVLKTIDGAVVGEFVVRRSTSNKGPKVLHFSVQRAAAAVPSPAPSAKPGVEPPGPSPSQNPNRNPNHKPNQSPKPSPGLNPGAIASVNKDVSVGGGRCGRRDVALAGRRSLQQLLPQAGEGEGERGQGGLKALTRSQVQQDLHMLYTYLLVRPTTLKRLTAKTCRHREEDDGRMRGSEEGEEGGGAQGKEGLARPQLSGDRSRQSTPSSGPPSPDCLCASCYVQALQVLLDVKQVSRADYWH